MQFSLFGYQCFSCVFLFLGSQAYLVSSFNAPSHSFTRREKTKPSCWKNSKTSRNLSPRKSPNRRNRKRFVVKVHLIKKKKKVPLFLRGVNYQPHTTYSLSLFPYSTPNDTQRTAPRAVSPSPMAWFRPCWLASGWRKERMRDGAPTARPIPLTPPSSPPPAL